jgi:hypothetical protein
MRSLWVTMLLDEASETLRLLYRSKSNMWAPLGIRPFPYSADFEIDPQTYDFINRQGYNLETNVHAKGSVWCTILIEGSLGQHMSVEGFSDLRRNEISVLGDGGEARIRSGLVLRNRWQQCTSSGRCRRLEAAALQPQLRGMYSDGSLCVACLIHTRCKPRRMQETRSFLQISKTMAAFMSATCGAHSRGEGSVRAPEVTSGLWSKVSTSLPSAEPINLIGCMRHKHLAESLTAGTHVVVVI